MLDHPWMKMDRNGIDTKRVWFVVVGLGVRGSRRMEAKVGSIGKTSNHCS